MRNTWKPKPDPFKPDHGPYFNHQTQAWAFECAQQGHPVVAVVDAAHRWFIKLGFAGFNSLANNGMGYSSKARAEAACLRYQGKGGT